MSLPIAIRHVSSFSRRKSGPSGRSASARRTRLSRAAMKRPRMETSPRKSHSQRWVAKEHSTRIYCCSNWWSNKNLLCENTALFKIKIGSVFNVISLQLQNSLLLAFGRARCYICQYIFFNYPLFACKRFCRILVIETICIIYNSQ